MSHGIVDIIAINNFLYERSYGTTSSTVSLTTIAVLGKSIVFAN